MERRTSQGLLGAQAPAKVPRGRFSERMATANAIAEQIWREQNLVSTRMTWNFTFQTFLVALFVFSGSNLEGLEKAALQITLCLVGVTVALAIFGAVWAAQEQSSRLKSHWVTEFCDDPDSVNDEIGCDVRSGDFPQPFSMRKHSRIGRWASKGICCVLIGMWMVLGVISYKMQDQDGPPRLVAVKSYADDSVEIKVSPPQKP